MIKQKSRLISTYSRRKQFRRVVQDNWNEHENVFNSSSEQKVSNHLTSTPIEKNKPAVPVPEKVTPLNLFNSGSFDTPIEERYPLKSIQHPRAVQGKRVCRRPPVLCPEPQDSQIDLFADPVEVSVKHSSPPKDVVNTKSESGSSPEIIAARNLRSKNHQNLNQDVSFKVVSVNCSQKSQNCIEKSASKSPTNKSSCNDTFNELSIDSPQNSSKKISDSSPEIILSWDPQSKPQQNDNSKCSQTNDSKNSPSPIPPPDTVMTRSLRSRNNDIINVSSQSENSNENHPSLSPEILPEMNVPSKLHDDSFFKLSNCSSQLHVQNASEVKNSEIIYENQDTDNQLNPPLETENLVKSPENLVKSPENLVKSPEKELVEDISQMSIVESLDNNDVSKMSVQEPSIHHVSQMEISIDECVSEEKIAVLNRSLMLASTVPSYKRLLSQCRREKDILAVLGGDKDCVKKIGEGTFGEVFLGKDTVYKIIPVGGTVQLNGVEQTSFENAFQEIVVSKKLSELAGDEVQMGKAFCQLKGVVFCAGRYPDILLKAWDDFENTENDRPDSLPEEQMYVVLLAKYSGIQLEDYCNQHKLTPDQAHSILRQICCSLAAAEQKFQFEHRDLHWGNVLIENTTMSHVDFTQDGKTFILKSHGLLATIIDFTFSRLETEGCLNFVDLEQEDWLFQGDAKVDIQYRVYRDMRSACRKNWSKFTPRTNVLWLLYLIDKMNIKIKSPKLKRLKQSLSSYKSATTALAMAFRSL